MGLGRRFGAIAPDEAPEQGLVVGRGDRDQIEQEREADRHGRRRHLAGMDVVDRIAELLVELLVGISGEELLIFVDRLAG